MCDGLSEAPVLNVCVADRSAVWVGKTCPGSMLSVVSGISGVLGQTPEKRML